MTDAWVGDCSSARPGGAALKAAGCVGLMRYAGALTTEFNITRDEVADLQAHGIAIGIVVEQQDDFLLRGQAVGNKAALAALQDTRAVGLPDGVSYFAGDVDLTLGGPTSPGSPGDVQMGKVHETLAGAAGVLGWDHVGFYGSYWAIQWLIDKAVPVAAFWQTEGFSVDPADPSKRLHHPKAVLIQRADTPPGVPTDCDYNLVLGDWKPRVATTPEVPTVAQLTGKLFNVDAELIHRVQALCNATGISINAQSGWRDYNYQLYLYNGWMARKPGFNPANPPWTSMHCKSPALAMDVTPNRSTPVLRSRAAEFGLCWPIPSEDWHIEKLPGWNGTIPSAVVLKVGSTGPAVTQLQNDLNAVVVKPYTPLAVDGDYGSGTAAAVRQFQHNMGLVVDGVAGDRTLGVLKALLSRRVNRYAGRPTVQQGSRGGDVTEVQRCLNVAAISTAIDGVFGPGTKAGVVLLQQRGGLVADGIVGAATWALLDHIMDGAGK